ncbi:uncharacterized protein LOC126841369 [Adelges cooleyi]|uniref:uncharacterized protein LOC126841369 n=1 Tax=Adelges cooleyi TaxID=133065 RepID=UPI0021803246|nr:uncharacterized protein LOC126841369 [Adelges cooleyi]
MIRFCVFVSYVILHVRADDLADYKNHVAITNKYIKLAGGEKMSLLFAAPDMEIKENELQQRIGYETKLQSEILEILKINYTDIEQKSCEFPALGHARRVLTLKAVKIAIRIYAVPPFLSAKIIEMPSSESKNEMLKRFNRMCRLRGLGSSIELPKLFIKQALVEGEDNNCCLTDCHDGLVLFNWKGIAY